VKTNLLPGGVEMLRKKASSLSARMGQGKMNIGVKYRK
jgi:hypothetical protein